MFNIFGIVKSLLRLAGVLSEWAKNRQLMKAGEAKAVNKGLVDAYKAIDRAKRAADNVDSKRLRHKYRRPSSDS
tara:strand:- start:1749 stop:1970 length:222 start_codon:yes stop_codon:yes gene_type:complete